MSATCRMQTVRQCGRYEVSIFGIRCLCAPRPAAYEDPNQHLTEIITFDTMFVSLACCRQLDEGAAEREALQQQLAAAEADAAQLAEQAISQQVRLHLSCN